MEENTFDIVQFIEKNPLSRLSKEYENTLINKIKYSFTVPQQQYFLTNFYNYLNYDNQYDFIIDLDSIWKWIGFSRKDPAKRLLDKFFAKDIDYKIMIHPTVEQNQHGGHNKEQILLTVNCFKKFCLKADTKKADEIHDYYIKLESLLQETIIEETDELRKQLQIKNDIIIRNEKSENHKLKIKKEETLLNVYKGKRCVYIGEIEENKFIKIGSSEDIIKRRQTHIKKYNNFIILDIFGCDHFREVESAILNDPIVKQNLYREPINNHTSQEVVLLSEEFTYQNLITIAKKCVSHTYFFSPEQILEKQKNDIKEKRLMIEEKKIELEKIKILNNIHSNHNNNHSMNENNIMSANKSIEDEELINRSYHPIETLSVQENLIYEDNKTPKTLIYEDYKIPENLICEDNKTSKILIYEGDKIPENLICEDNKTINSLHFTKSNTQITDDNIENDTDNAFQTIRFHKRLSSSGKKIQKIDPVNTDNVIKVYDNISNLINSHENKDMKVACIRHAIKNNRIYKGFRWDYVEEDQDPNISKITQINSNKKIRRNNTMIVELDSTKNKIVNTYSSKEELIKKLNMCKPTLRKIINNKILYNNFYYIDYDDCPEYLLNDYNKPINTHISVSSKPIKRIHPFTKEETIFNSLSDIYVKLNIAQQTIHKAIKTKKMYSGFFWEYA